MIASTLAVGALTLATSAQASTRHHAHRWVHRASIASSSRNHRLARFSTAHAGHRRMHVASTRSHVRSAHFARLVRRSVGPRLAYNRTTTAITGMVQTGRASFYSGGRTATGGRVGAATCAHRSLPFGTRVLVTNLSNQRQAVLTVNDRGPFVRGRVVDVSRIAAGTLGMVAAGIATVRVQVLGGPG